MKSFLRESYIGSRAVGRSENSGGHDLLTPLVEIGLTVISKKNYLGGGHVPSRHPWFRQPWVGTRL